MTKPNDALAELLARDADELPFGVAGEFLAPAPGRPRPVDRVLPAQPWLIERTPKAVDWSAPTGPATEGPTPTPFATPNLDRVRAEMAQEVWRSTSLAKPAP